MKNQQRMSFKKSKRNNFIDKFKFEVKETNSIDKMRISQINESDYKIFHSQSPTKRHSLSSKLSPQPYQSKPVTKHSFDQSHQKTVKVKIKLVSPRQQFKTTARNIDWNQANEETLENQKGSNCSQIRFLPNESKVVTQEIKEAASIMIENTKKLKKHYFFQQQTQELDNILQNLNKKINFLSMPNESLIRQSQTTAQLVRKQSSLQGKLHQTEDSLAYQRKQIQKTKKTVNKNIQLDQKQKINSNESKCYVQSISSFQIENESTHWKQHLNIYDQSKAGVKSSSNRQQIFKSIQRDNSQDKIPTSNHNRVTSDTHLLKIQEKTTNKKQYKDKKSHRNQSELVQQKSRNNCPVEDEQNSSSAPCSTSTIEHEKKRLVLNQIICLLNKKYNKKIHFA